MDIFKLDWLLTSFDEKSYRLVNAFLLLGLGILSISIVLIYYCFDIDVCLMRAWFKEECLLCGCTRDFIGILRLQWPTLNIVSLYLFIGLVLECCYRCLGTIIPFPRWMAKLDILGHLIFFTSIFIYYTTDVFLRFFVFN